MPIQKTFVRLIGPVLLALITSVFGVGCEEETPTVEPANQVTVRDDEVTNKIAEPASRESVSKSVQGNVDAEAEARTEDQRKRIAEEATAALTETRSAISALEKENADEALAALERATGKLELLLARKPELSLAPTSVAVKTLDLLTTLEGIEEMRDQASEALEEGRVQDARDLLRNMGSEVILSVTNIPLATYPEAIRAAVPLIDQGKLDEARQTLAAALHTLVVTNHVIPLPIVRAEAMLARAQKLAENAERSQSENKKLSELLNNARYQLQLGEALGYGTEDEYEAFYEQLDRIAEKTKAGKSEAGLFDKIRALLSDAKETIFS